MANRDYEPHFDIDFERGKVGEEAHKAFLYGKHEVKTDYKAGRTGNFYIETRQYNQNMEVLSGINTTEADYWVFAAPNGVGAIYLTTQALKDLMTKINPREARQPIYNENSNASVGRLVPITEVLKALGFSE